MAISAPPFRGPTPLGPQSVWRVFILLSGICFLFIHPWELAAQSGVTADHSSEPSPKNDSDLPNVDWSVDWKITRSRPGYPLLRQAQHFMVQPPGKQFGAYHHHPQITYSNGIYFVAWSNHPTGEDGPGQAILGAYSVDGQKWSEMGELFAKQDRTKPSNEFGRSLLASPFIVVKNRVFAVAMMNDSIGYGAYHSPVNGTPQSKIRTDEFPKRIRKGLGFLLRELPTSVDSLKAKKCGVTFWMGQSLPTPKPGFSFAVAKDVLPQSLIGLLRAQMYSPAKKSPWDFELPDAEPIAKDGSPLCEPCTGQTDDGLLIRYFRDLAKSQKLYVQFSRDQGRTWTSATRTNIPDAPSKSVFGRLPDGQYFLVGNQVVSKRGTRRDPLTIGLSPDGTTFHRAYSIRWRTPAFRVPKQQEQRDGRGRGFQYPSFVIADGHLYIVYSVNKESIECSRIPLSALAAQQTDPNQ